MKEKNICVKVDAEYFKRIKMKVAREGITLREYILKLVAADMDKED